MDPPAGTPILSDEGELMDRLVLFDEGNMVTWTIRFFENLHMDLRESMRGHLEAGIQKQTRTLFEDEFWKSFEGNTTSMRPITQEDPSWSPVIELEYKDVATVSNTTCPAMMLIYRKSYRPGEQIVVGRFCLPVVRGLVEIEVEAVDKGLAWREAAVVADLCKDQVMTTEKLQAALKSHEFDSSQYDDKFPSHSLSRVRKALQWLTEEARLIATEPPLSQTFSPAAEIMLTHLGCAFRPPPRYLYCPNLSNPESNKQRFYRATLGGSVGVEMLVVSVWYTHSYAPHLRKAGNANLSKIAQHGAGSIHRAQNFRNIRVTVEDAPVSRRKSWLGGASNKDAVITVVDCEEAGGVRCQNTIGWIRDPNSDIVHLMYYADTLGIDQKEMRTELLDSLFSLRTVTGRSHSGRRGSSKSLWNVNSSMTVGGSSRSSY